MTFVYKGETNSFTDLVEFLSEQWNAEDHEVSDLFDEFTDLYTHGDLTSDCIDEWTKEFFELAGYGRTDSVDSMQDQAEMKYDEVSGDVEGDVYYCDVAAWADAHPNLVNECLREHGDFDNVDDLYSTTQHQAKQDLFYRFMQALGQLEVTATPSTDLHYGIYKGHDIKVTKWLGETEHYTIYLNDDTVLEGLYGYDVSTIAFQIVLLHQTIDKTEGNSHD